MVFHLFLAVKCILSSLSNSPYCPVDPFLLRFSSSLPVSFSLVVLSSQWGIRMVILWMNVQLCEFFFHCCFQARQEGILWAAAQRWNIFFSFSVTLCFFWMQVEQYQGPTSESRCTSPWCSQLSLLWYLTSQLDYVCPHNGMFLIISGSMMLPRHQQVETDSKPVSWRVQQIRSATFWFHIIPTFYRQSTQSVVCKFGLLQHFGKPTRNNTSSTDLNPVLPVVSVIWA